MESLLPATGDVMDWSGVVVVDKPTGLTSRQIVDKVARIVRPAKAGHAGTLDPLATGVLVVAIGCATRLISYIQQGRKRYIGRFELGKRSDTDDSEGQIRDGGDWSGITRDQLDEAIEQFTGVIHQVPPQFSAVHVDGQRAYALARRGQTVDLQARPVEVFSVRVTQFAPPEFELELECGSGTYVRSIGRDLGEQLGCGAIMTSLRRLTVGPFSLENAVPYDKLDVATLQAALQPPVQAIADLPRRNVDDNEAKALRQGKVIGLGPFPFPESATEAALIDLDNRLIGVARIEATLQRLQPYIIFPAKK
jgi:tRNA pseudouridine55 synthase